MNGKWNEGEGDAATADKTVTLTGHDGDTLKLTADQIPAVGSKPNDTYKAGSWDVMPSVNTAITEATTYTYTYAQKDSISQTVTFKVVNGSWNDETTTDKTVTLTGYEGDTLKLAADQIPAVGTKPNDTYKAGSWDVTPSAEAEITEATTYTYTYAEKEAAVVTKVPTDKTLTYNGQAQELVTAGEATGGEMQYALGTKDAATESYTTSIPTATDAGTYYVWYKVKGNANHNDSKAVSVPVTINKASIDPTVKMDGWTVGETAKEPSLKDGSNPGNGKVTYTYAKKGENKFTSDKPTTAGQYTVKAEIAETDNYKGGSATADFTIAAKPHEHTWGDWEVTRKATCVAKGEKKRICSECKKEETEEIDIDPNNHTGRTEIKSKKDATESAEGYTGDTYCKDCGVKLKSGKAIPKLEKKQEEKTEPQKEEKKPFTDFRTLRLTASKRSKDAITLKWRKYADADGYLVYGCKCGEGSKMKLLKTIKGNKNVTWTHKKLKKGTYYKYKVVVYKNNKGKKKTLVNSTAVHTTTTGAKRTVSKAVKVNKTKATVKKGKTFQIKASEVKDEKKKKIEHHRDICYESSNKKIATVNEKGKVKGVKKGTATIFVYSETGHYKTVKVTVK